MSRPNLFLMSTDCKLHCKPTDITGPEGYILLHRGAGLDESKLSIGRVGQLLIPFLGSKPLR